LIDERSNLDAEHPSAKDKEDQYNKSDFISVIKKSGNVYSFNVFFLKDTL
jgi:hypothetical protein